jgi:hypothetical protein
MDKGFWEALTAIGTLAAAIATAWMACYTRKAIKDGQAQRRDADRQFAETRKQANKHHQEQFRPLLVVVPSGDGAPTDRMGFVAISDPNDAVPSIYVKCAVQNIGVGPALNVKLSVRSDGITGFGPTRELSPIAINGVLVGTDNHFRLPVIYHKGFNMADLCNAPHGLWSLALEYEDVFGNKFHTLHRKDQGALWTQSGRGLPPDAVPPTFTPAHIPATVSTAEWNDQPGPVM